MAGFLTLWPVLGLILIPGILLLYILKQRAKPYAFSTVMPWKEAFRNLEATKPWEKLRQNLLLWLQILAIVLFVLAMMGPRLFVDRQLGEAVILVLDNSASMDTRYEEDISRLEAAKEAACQKVDDLPEDVPVSVIVCNQQASLLVSGSKDHRAVKSLIQKIEQTSLPGNLSQALGMAASCANQVEAPKLLLYTDTAVDAGNLDAEVISLYRQVDNLSMDSFYCTQTEDKMAAMALLTNRCGSTKEVEVNLYGLEDGSSRETLLDIKKAEIAEGQSTPVLFELPLETSASYIAFRAEINESDGLQGDNERFCAAETVRGNRILLVTESNLFAEKAFSILSGMEVFRTADPAAISDEEDYDLYIFDGILPEKLPQKGSYLFLNCKDSGNAGLFESKNKIEHKRLQLRESVVTQYVAGTKIGVSEGWIYQIPVWGSSFLQLEEQTAGFYGIYDGHRIAVLGFDLHQSDFALTAEFPILISNLADYLLNGSLLEASEAIAGDSLLLHGSIDGENLQILAPDGSRQEIPADSAYGTYLSVPKTGLYRISQKKEGTEQTQYLAVRFPSALESDVISAETAAGSQSVTEAGNRTGVKELRRGVLLLLLFLLLLEFAIYLRQMPKKRAFTRKLGEILLRAMVLGLVILSIFGLQIRKENTMTTTVYLMDLSDSVSGAVEEEEDFVRSAIAQMEGEEQAAIVLFGKDAVIEQFVTDRKLFAGIQSQVVSSATNLEQAVDTAMALFPDETAKRLVLLTDGQENQGSLMDTLPSLRQMEVEVKVVRLDHAIGEEVYISNMSMPSTISIGDSFRVQVDLYASVPTAAKVTLYSGRTVKGQKEVTLEKGMNHLVFADTGVEAGLCSYRVTVEAEKDNVHINNSFSAFTNVQAPAKVLLVEGNIGEAEEFCRILQAANIHYDKCSPSGVPNKVAELIRYDSVIFQNVYAEDLRSGFLDALDDYVKDYAGGFVAIGGPDSYALGNYQNTQLEELLPVSSTLRGEKEIPKIAMVMVIDHSGSMDAPSTVQGGVSCLQVAKNAAAMALQSLRPIDQVGVVSFDDAYDWAVPLQELENEEAVRGRIASIPSGGGTSIYPAVNAALQELKKSDASIRHIVLLTDGQDGYHVYDPLLKELKEQQITLSTVAIGSDADSSLLSMLAENGGGRYYYSDAGTTLPRIFAQEVFLSTKEYLINEEFLPQQTGNHEILAEVLTEGMPAFKGYVATTAKPSALLLLRSHREDPILAVWQYGLGRTAAWTSDASNQWTGNLAAWKDYPALWKNIIDWTISDRSPGEDQLEAVQEGGSVRITYRTGNYSDATRVEAVMNGEDGSQKKVQLTPTAPGCYEAVVDLDQTGVYSVNLRNQKGEELVKAINSAAAIQYSQEYRFADAANCLDHFLTASGGREIQKPQEVSDTRLKGKVSAKDRTIWVILAALLLFVADIACRRLSLDWISRILGWRKYLNRPLHPAKTEEKPSQEKPAEERPAERKPEKAKAVKPSKTAPKPKAGGAIDTQALLKKKKERDL